MYKVFFKDRAVFLTDNFTSHFKEKYGLFYKYKELDELKELVGFYARLKTIKALYIFHDDIEVLREDFQKCFIPIKAGGGLVRNKKGEFLLIFRRGVWDLPKGKLQKNESFEEGALREVEEECGLSGIKLQRPLMSTYHTYPFKEGTALKKTMWFEMVYQGKKEPVPQSEEDISDIKWIRPNKLEHYLQQCFPAVRDVFTYFGI